MKSIDILVVDKNRRENPRAIVYSILANFTKESSKNNPWAFYNGDGTGYQRITMPFESFKDALPENSPSKDDFSITKEFISYFKDNFLIPNGFLVESVFYKY